MSRAGTSSTPWTERARNAGFGGQRPQQQQQQQPRQSRRQSLRTQQSELAGGGSVDSTPRSPAASLRKPYARPYHQGSSHGHHGSSTDRSASKHRQDSGWTTAVSRLLSNFALPLKSLFGFGGAEDQHPSQASQPPTPASYPPSHGVDDAMALERQEMQTNMTEMRPPLSTPILARPRAVELLRTRSTTKSIRGTVSRQTPVPADEEYESALDKIGSIPLPIQVPLETFPKHDVPEFRLPIATETATVGATAARQNSSRLESRLSNRGSILPAPSLVSTSPFRVSFNRPTSATGGRSSKLAIGARPTTATLLNRSARLRQQTGVRSNTMDSEEIPSYKKSRFHSGTSATSSGGDPAEIAAFAKEQLDQIHASQEAARKMMQVMRPTATIAAVSSMQMDGVRHQNGNMMMDSGIPPMNKKRQREEVPLVTSVDAGMQTETYVGNKSPEALGKSRYGLLDDMAMEGEEDAQSVSKVQIEPVAPKKEMKSFEVQVNLEPPAKQASVDGNDKASKETSHGSEQVKTSFVFATPAAPVEASTANSTGFASSVGSTTFSSGGFSFGPTSTKPAESKSESPAKGFTFTSTAPVASGGFSFGAVKPAESASTASSEPTTAAPVVEGTVTPKGPSPSPDDMLISPYRPAGTKLKQSESAPSADAPKDNDSMSMSTSSSTSNLNATSSTNGIGSNASFTDGSSSAAASTTTVFGGAGSSTGGGFTFGAPKPEPVASAPVSTGGFTFGATTPSNSVETSKPVTTFAFGQVPAAGTGIGATSVEQKKEEPKPFTFGSASSSTSAPPAAPSQNGFTFGAPSNAPPTAPETKPMDAPASTGFTFGGANATFSFNAPATNATATDSSNGGASFGFGASSATPATSAAATPSTGGGGFTFGANGGNASTSGGFAFGAPTAPASAPAPTTTTFAFGNNAQMPPAQAQPAAQGGFTFGGAQPQATSSGATGGFTFGAPSAASEAAVAPPPTTTFAFGSGAPSQPPAASSGFSFNFGGAPNAPVGGTGAVGGAFAFGAPPTSQMQQQQPSVQQQPGGFTFGAQPQPQQQPPQTPGAPTMFNMGASSAPSAGNVPPGQRKLAQPRSRRSRK